MFPCNPKDKSRFVMWKTEATTDREKIIEFWNKYPRAIPGLMTGVASGFAVVDLDVKNGKNGIEEFERLGLELVDAGAVVRTAGGGLHLYYEHADGVRNSQDKYAPGIDIRAEGGYVIAPGAVNDVGMYEIESGGLDVTRLLCSELPELFLPTTKAVLQCSTALYAGDPEEIRLALSYIPNDQNYDKWMRNIIACKAGFDGSEEGLQIVQDWCADYPGYDPAEVEKM